MRLRRLSRDDRGVSVVIGTVLLIGMVTMSMAVLGAAVLSTDLVDSPPRAEFVYQEDGTGNVTIGLTDVQKLTADGTEIKLEGEGSCGTWDGSGDLEKGDITIVDGCDLEKGDVLQVIGSNTLLDTYELQGAVTSPDHGCEVIDYNESTIKLDSGDTLSCNIPEDGSQVNNGLKIDEGTTLLGEVNITKTIELTASGENKIVGDITTGKDANIKDDSTIDGTVSADESVYVRESSQITGSVDAGDSVDVDQDATVDGPIDSGDYVELDKDAVVESSVTAASDVTIGNSAEIDGAVESGYDVSLDQDSLADDDVTLTGSDRTLELSDGATISGTVSAADNDVTLKGDAKISGDVIGDTVTCKDTSTVEGTVTADTDNC